MLLATALFSSVKLHAIVKLTRVRLARAYQILEAQLRQWAVEFVEASAGVFVWARLLRPRTPNGETEVIEHGTAKAKVNGDAKVDGEAKASPDWETQQIEQLRDSGVLVSPGQAYHVTAWPREKGWVRITFAVDEGQLREGLRKIGKCLGLGKRERVAEQDEEEMEESRRKSRRRDNRI